MRVDPEARYQALFATTLDAIMIVDDEGRYVDVNESLCHLLKTPRQELLGAHFSQFIPPEFLESASADFSELKTSGFSESEFPLRARDGSIVEVEWRSRGNFVPGLHFCVARDITARRQAEREIERQQQELTDFVENATIALHWVGPDGTILWANRAELELLGYSREEYIGHHIAEFHADPDIIEDILRRLSAREELHSYEARLRRKDGSLRYVLISSNVLWDEDRFVHTRCFTRDITRQTHSERRIAAEHAVTRILAEAATLEEAARQLLQPLCEIVDGEAGELWEVDATGRALYCTAAWARSSSPEIEQFQAGCRSITFAPGIGLPGRVWRERRAATIQELARDQNFPRLSLARAAGLHGGLAIPLISGEEFFGVLEFFTRRPFEPDAPLLQMLTAIGHEIGLFSSRRRAEQALAAEQERLRVTLASIGDAVIVTDPEGRPTFLNPVAEALTGWTQSEARGKPLEEVFRIVNEQTRRTVESPVQRVLREGTVMGLANHTVLIARNGSERAIDDSAAPIHEDQDGVIGVVLVFRDVTERRRAEEVRSRLAAIVESSDLAIFSKDMSGIVTSWNRAAEQLYGYSAAEMIGQPITRIIPLDHPDEFPVLMQRLRRGERIEQYETVRVRKDGERVDVLVSISPVRNDSGQISGASIIARDITETKEVAAALRESEARFRAAAEAADMAFFILRAVRDPAAGEIADFEIVELNRRGATLIGIPREQAMHGRVLKLVPAARRLGLFDRYRRVLESGEALQEEFSGGTGQSTNRWFWQQVVPLGDGLAITLLNITARKRLEQELRERAEELAEADRAKDDFLAMLAHELRNPLAPIKNALHMLGLQREDSDRVERLRAILERQVQHMTRMIDDLLDVSRITRGKIAIQREPLNLSNLVRVTFDDQRPAFEEAGLTAVLRLPETPAWTLGDTTRLTQVLDNLLENARKFTDQGGQVTLELSLDAPRQQAVIAVRDTGIGIEPEMLPRLFDVFAQADRSLDRSRGGLGLGLALVKGLVELHEGSIETRSQGVGQGAEFILRLALTTPPVAGRLLGAGPPAVAGSEGIGLRILIIEDNRDAAESLRDLLELHGCQVTVAHAGPVGLEMAQQSRPEVIICDIGLPGMDGYAVASALRQDEGLSQTWLIAISGYGQDEDLRRSRRAGFDGHLVKPVDPERLLKHLQEARIADNSQR
jgi:PAS domain S-box-containing protein